KEAARLAEEDRQRRRDAGYTVFRFDFAPKFTLRDASGAPDGKIEDVKGTGLDFRTPTNSGAHINDGDPQIASGHGFNQNYILDGKVGTLRLRARVVEPETGRVLEM